MLFFLWHLSAIKRHIRALSLPPSPVCCGQHRKNEHFEKQARLVHCTEHFECSHLVIAEDFISSSRSAFHHCQPRASGKWEGTLKAMATNSTMTTAKVIPASELYSQLLQANALLQAKDGSTTESKEFADQLLDLLQPIVVELDKYRGYQQQPQVKQKVSETKQKEEDGKEEEGAKLNVDGSDSVLFNHPESLEFAALVLDTLQTLLAQEPVISLIANNNKRITVEKSKQSSSHDSSLLGLWFGSTTQSSSVAKPTSGTSVPKGAPEMGKGNIKEGENTMKSEDENANVVKDEDVASKSPGNNPDATNTGNSNRRTSWLPWVSPTPTNPDEGAVNAKKSREGETPVYPWVAQQMNLTFESRSSVQQRPPPPPLVDSSPMFGGWFGSGGTGSNHSKQQKEGDNSTQRSIRGRTKEIVTAPLAGAALSPPLQRKSWHSSLVPWLTSLDLDEGENNPQKLEILVHQDDADEFASDCNDAYGIGKAVYPTVAAQMLLTFPYEKEDDSPADVKGAFSTKSEDDINPLVRDEYQQKIIERELNASREFKANEQPPAATGGSNNRRSPLLSVVDWMLPATTDIGPKNSDKDNAKDAKETTTSDDEKPVYPWVTEQMKLTLASDEADVGKKKADEVVSTANETVEVKEGVSPAQELVTDSGNVEKAQEQSTWQKWIPSFVGSGSTHSADTSKKLDETAPGSDENRGSNEDVATKQALRREGELHSEEEKKATDEDTEGEQPATSPAPEISSPRSSSKRPSSLSEVKLKRVTPPPDMPSPTVTTKKETNVASPPPSKSHQLSQIKVHQIAHLDNSDSRKSSAGGGANIELAKEPLQAKPKRGSVLNAKAMFETRNESVKNLNDSFNKPVGDFSSPVSEKRKLVGKVANVVANMSSPVPVPSPVTTTSVALTSTISTSLGRIKVTEVHMEDASGERGLYTGEILYDRKLPDGQGEMKYGREADRCYVGSWVSGHWEVRPNPLCIR